MSPITRAWPALALMLVACGQDVSISLDPPAAAAEIPPEPVDIEPEPVLVIETPATVQAQATRSKSFVVIETNPPVAKGLNGLPFAPEGLDACDEMMFYGAQFGLPEWFRGIGWRESNCRNEDGVKTFCCHGYWQLYVSLHLKDHRLGHRYRDECGVHSKDDVNSDVPIEKQRQACAVSVLYDVMGSDPWRATR